MSALITERIRSQQGFTLIELIVTLTLSGILAAAVWRNISAPVTAFNDQARRARLVDRAAVALDRMSRELRLALPNSIRISGGTAVEFLRTVSGGRYRDQVSSTGTGSPLSFTTKTGTFDVLGVLSNVSSISAGASNRASCLASTADCLVIYNSGQSGADVYAGDNLAGVMAATSSSVQFSRSDASGPFPYRSPQQRFYIVDTPVSFVCDTVAGDVRHYADYPIGTTQTAPPGSGSNSLLVDQVTGCDFSYVSGSSTRSAVVNVSLTLSEEGESVSLLQQVHIPNVP